LRNRKTLVIPRPEYSDEALAAHAAATVRRDAFVTRLKAIKEIKLAKLRLLADSGDDDAAIGFLELEYEMAKDATAAATPLPITLQGDEASAHSNAWKQRMEDLVLHMIHILEQYTKTHVIDEVARSDSFDQEGGEAGYDRESWKETTENENECSRCEKVGHPTETARNAARGKGKPKTQDDDTKTQDDDTRSVSSTASSKSSKCSQASSTSSGKSSKELETLMKQVKCTEALLAAQIAVEDAQAKCDSFDEEEELNEFLQEWKQYGFLQQCSASDGERLRLDNLLILDIQAAATVICNKRLVTDIRASKKTLRLKSNGGTIQIKQQATMEGFRDPVWYSPKDRTWPQHGAQKLPMMSLFGLAPPRCHNLRSS
jgi:hypothetical protein